MEAVLRAGVWGALGLCSEGKPYVVPLNYAYADGKILFHCALEGMKLDMIRANPQVCFTVARQTGTPSEHPGGKPCEVDSDSVICYGRARIVEDAAERAPILNTFNRAFRPDAEDLPMERVRRCGAVEITVTEMTGRRERDGKRSFWRHV
jgi:nitroimidazol reductase NimA-like FMN-containing flavoprotein (pyridoxamine 5'-phosphate oxidase superfamily)